MEETPRPIFFGKFEKLSPVGTSDKQLVEPVGRSGHCCAADDNNLYVFGGYNPSAGPLMSGHGAATLYFPSRQVMSELWVYNFARRIWNKIESRDTPHAAASSCMKLVNNKLFVYGGTVFPFGHLMSNTLHICDISDNYKWHLVEASSGNVDHLPPRAYGQSIFLHEGCVYSFGGAVSFYMEPVSDLHCLHINDLNGGRHQWEKLQPTGDTPKGRYKQEIVVDGDQLFVLGGGHLAGAESLERLHMYCFSTNHWCVVYTKADPKHGFPKNRSCFGCVQSGRTVLVSGGRNYDVATMNHDGMQDMWALSLDGLKWQHLPVLLPNTTYFHGVALNSLGVLSVYGGIVDGDVRTSDLYKLQIYAPKLSELCWEHILRSIPNLHEVPIERIHQLGIPHMFVNRLKT